MLEAFKIKEFDLTPIFESWANPPMFYGESKKDMPVDDWLGQIKAGCVERKVPEEYWHKVAQHYMGEKAKARLGELKTVMAKVNGGKYRWSWKKFKIAMGNMGWEIDTTVTTPVTVQRRSSGHFWLTRRKSSKDQISKEVVEVAKVEVPPPPPKESRPNPVKMLSETAVLAATSAFKSRHPPQRANTMDPAVMARTVSSAPLPPLPQLPLTTQPTPESNAVTTVSNVPTWLLNACHALDFLTTEHPRAMTTLSAVLITAGTLPAIPAISGGTVLATGVAQAVGAIAVGVGNLLKASQEGQVQVTGQSQAGPHPPMRAATFQ
ncbi:hypothetical protein HYDPIDRAFT_112300 [Hydnomerulius pinastri MD-312]|uniref:Uncharacterized protein n=1 Tax=Hydnomerulius pinastri MD-312 TaxID=994086 RepID=A0A0C9VFL1_9AGAM|nr:hypothetical protein HYDPIDRAFT_112300 [Hydnomerulius pinastri MD-312]